MLKDIVKLMNKITRSLVVFAFSIIGLSGYADNWNGINSDVSWFSDSESEFHIQRADQLMGLSDLVKTGNSFEGKTIYLEDDLNMNYHDWQPIGGNYYGGTSFNGIFDGKNHKISSLHPAADPYTGNSLRHYGLFGEAGEKSIVKNIAVSGSVDIVPQSLDILVYVGGIVGCSSGVIENVKANFNISAGKEIQKTVIESFYAGGICGQANIVKKAKASGEISLAYGNIYWRVNNGRIGGIVGSGSVLEQVDSEVAISVWAKDKGYVGGVAGTVYEGGSVKNATFYGSLKDSEDNFVYGESPLYSACGGIIGGSLSSDVEISNCISAPKAFETNFTSYWISPIIGTNATYDYAGGNNYYTIPVGYSNVLGNQVDEVTLAGATSLPNFDNDIWDFSNGKPMLKALKVQYYVSVRLDKGFLGYVVSDGGSLYLKLMADDGYAVSKVYFDDTDVSDCLQGQDLNLTNISSSGELKFIFVQDASGIGMVESNAKPNFSIEGNKIVFNELFDSTSLKVYNMEGRLVCSMKVNSNQSISLNSGIYIIKVGKNTFKVSI